jgi:hypothetical protein
MIDMGSETLVLARELKSSSEEVNAQVVTTAEISECNCPDFCERDHERD